MKKLTLCLLLICSACSAQVTFSGALLLGKINVAASTSGTFDPSSEFNSTDWPSGYGLAGSGITLSGTAAVLYNTSLETAAPSGDWTVETLITASTTENVSQNIGLSINGQAMSGTDPTGIALLYGNGATFYVKANTDGGNESTGDLTATTVKLKIQKSGTELTLSYALDAGAYTVLASDATALEIATAGYSVGIYHLDGDVTEAAAFDYLRFTTP
jgi:hypothetical protein